MTRPRIAGALLSALALSVIPSTAGAADPEPPSGCESTTGYSKDGSFSGRLTICFTKEKTYSSSEGREGMSPAVSVKSECRHKTLLAWSDQGSCKWTGDLSMKKDGVQRWKERWGKATAATHKGDRTTWGPYRCRGNGIYALTLDNIDMKSSSSGVVGGWEPVYPKPVTLTAKGC
ncbi:hypothetical protein [Streptomyces sp. NPDC051662]|uniref:hypothetical protein n=1 Tax=Streptomyces sp. NPDC051662 TaxID=3154750 RepID=UPI003422DFCE